MSTFEIFVIVFITIMILLLLAKAIYNNDINHDREELSSSPRYEDVFDSISDESGDWSIELEKDREKIRALIIQACFVPLKECDCNYELEKLMEKMLDKDFNMKEVKTLKLEVSSWATLGGMPYDIIVNGENIGTIAVVDEDDIIDNTYKLLDRKGFTISPRRLHSLLGIEI